MKTWGLVPSAETFLTLACAYAKAGDWQGVERVVGEAAAQGTTSLGTMDSNAVNVFFAVCDGAPSCWKLHCVPAGNNRAA